MRACSDRGANELNRAAIADVADKVSEIATLNRYYRATHVASFLGFDGDEFRMAAPATRNTAQALPILTYLVGFDGNTAATIQRELDSYQPAIEGILKIGDYYGGRSGDAITVSSLEHFSLSVLITSLLGHLLNFVTYRTLATPALERYLSCLRAATDSKDESE